MSRHCLALSTPCPRGGLNHRLEDEIFQGHRSPGKVRTRANINTVAPCRCSLCRSAPSLEGVRPRGLHIWTTKTRSPWAAVRPPPVVQSCAFWWRGGPCRLSSVTDHQESPHSARDECIWGFGVVFWWSRRKEGSGGDVFIARLLAYGTEEAAFLVLRSFVRRPRFRSV